MGLLCVFYGVWSLFFVGCRKNIISMSSGCCKTIWTCFGKSHHSFWRVFQKTEIILLESEEIISHWQENDNLKTLLSQRCPEILLLRRNVGGLVNSCDLNYTTCNFLRKGCHNATILITVDLGSTHVINIKVMTVIVTKTEIDFHINVKALILASKSHAKRTIRSFPNDRL